MNALKGIIKIMDTILLLIGIAVCIFFLGGAAMRAAGIQTYIVLSGSMEPKIPVGSLVMVNSNDKETQEGDVITYTLTGDGDKAVYVTHRVIDIDPKGSILTKGDKNTNPDCYIDPQNVKGTVLFCLPYAGYVVRTVKEPLVIMIYICIFLLVRIALLLFKTRERQKTVQKK